MPDLAPVPSLPEAFSGHHGAAGTPGVVLAVREGLAVAVVAARRGREADVAAAVERALGLRPSEGPKAVAGGGSVWIGAGPGQWLVVAEDADDFVSALTGRLTGLAAVTDHSDGRVVLRVSGPRARDALAKGFAVDLHPRAFAPGDAAATQAAHIGAQIWQVDDAPTYDVAVARSYAASFWSWLTASAAEFGAVVEPVSGAAPPP
ncbi:MAG TPA: sarcosine oxidase subunit gamma family protein [Beijerinckiaceae bacterium]|nr:sarcosine oxidase subunit gamma family protein [Beijerinckiaceae bacterium]